MDNQRNLLLAVALCAALLLGWELLIKQLYPQAEQPQITPEADTPAAQVAADGDAMAMPGAQAESVADLETQLASTGRVAIEAPEIVGSINPVGARIDDIALTTHREEVERDSGPVRLFAPAGTPVQQFAQFGWAGQGIEVPDARTTWRAEGERLTPESPVTLRWDNDTGQRFAIRFEIDDRYMITATQTVANAGQGSVALRPAAIITRTSESASIDQWLVHSGPLAAYDGSVKFGTDYDDVVESGTVREPGESDWIGFTDIYWLSALIPQDGMDVDASFRSLGNDVFRADMIYEPVTIGAGRQLTRTTRLFAGAKETETLDAYEAQGVTNFGLAIDWGWFRWFEKPIFWALRQLFALVGNFGVAIMLLTLLIRGLLFPIAQKQFASMAAMRAIQPKMKALQERYKDDKQKQQQEIMALYKREKVNPLAGCLPLLLQMPIFFALYKTLILAIEMRHQPFVLWIRDLSAPDPATILNLFGLLPFTPPSFLAIGVLAVLLGVTMWLQFRLNPAQMEPMQQQIFMIMPWVLMFVMAPFDAGLLLYWVTNNILTIGQQAYLYSRHPQLKAQAAKDKEEAERKKTREAKAES